MSKTIGWRIGEVIRLKVRDGKQSELAAILDCSDDAVSRWVNNQTKPETKYILLMGEKLRISPSWLLFGEGPMTLGGTEPRGTAERTTLETAERAHWEYVVDRLSAEFPRDIVERHVPAGAEMLATSLRLCRETIVAKEAHRTPDGRPVAMQTTTTMQVLYGPMLGEFSEALLKHHGKRPK